MYRVEGTGASFHGFKLGTLQRFMEEGKIVEAPVKKCDADLNLHVDLGFGTFGIIPYEECSYITDGRSIKVSEVKARVGRFTCFKVMEIKENEEGIHTAILSRREAQKDCYENFISKLRVGQVIDAKIKHTEKYGAFCDIGCGIVALLPVDNFCIARISNPKEELKQYSKLKVAVSSIRKDGKIVLTHKELLGTWEEEVAKFEVDSVVQGKVRKIDENGTFVELTPNLVGLADTTDKPIHLNDIVSVYIKSIVPSQMKVKLVVVGLGDQRVGGEFDYRIPKEGVLKEWRYSPEGCNKLNVVKFGKAD